MSCYPWGWMQFYWCRTFHKVEHGRPSGGRLRNKMRDVQEMAHQEMSAPCPWWKPHKWPKWSDKFEGTMATGHPFVIQERRCECCNMVQRRMDKATRI